MDFSSLHRKIKIEERECAERCLREAGWFPGRSVDASLALEELRSRGHDPPQSIADFLAEFDGLHIQPSRIDFDIATEGYSSHDDILLEDLPAFVGERVFPVGSGYTRHGTIVLGESGRVFVEWDSQCWYIAEETREGLELLVSGFNGTKLPVLLAATGAEQERYAVQVALENHIARGVEPLNLPAHLEGTARLVARAFRWGVENWAYLPLLSSLQPHLRDTDLAEVVGRVFLREDVLSDVHAVAAGMEFDPADLRSVRIRLDKAGFEAWCVEMRERTA